ncbi:MAG: hypothetical protein KGM24_12130 [Elusimicrobia bacterium]|nr:hypothetical protein [Elusimicrobiota bacterium]
MTRRGTAAVLLFAVLINLPFLGKAYSLDAPYYLAIARQILAHPRHPLAFSYNWFGTLAPVAGFQHSVLVPYLLAPLLALTKGREALMRLCLLPVDLLAAVSLYGLAAEFLQEPLWPALIVLACPSFFLCMPQVMLEAWIVALSLASLWALAASFRPGRGRWFWASALLASTAIVIKHTAVFLLPLLLAELVRRKVPPRRLAAYMLLALAPAAADALWLEPWRLRATESLSSGISPLFQLRTFLAFAGGCGAVTLAWPYARAESPRRSHALRAVAALAAVLLLFSPIADARGAPIRLLDRATGILFAWPALLALLELAEPKARARPGWGLWAAWIAADSAMLLLAPWNLSGRSMLFLLPPLILSSASRLESALEPRRLRRVYAASLAGTLALSLALGWVDARYADAQRELAASVQRALIDRGRRVWVNGHWGFQYYMEKAGAVEMDARAGGWKEVRPGDAVVFPSVNVVTLRRDAGVWRLPPAAVVESRVPLRLMSFRSSQAGFYSNLWGFLPFALSREPIDAFRIVTTRADKR